jgi:predicted nucleic acid-binding protein
MIRVLFDTNTILDVLLNREPWVRESREIWRANDENRISGYIVASAFTDIFYIARKLTDVQTARAAIEICLNAFAVCPVSRETLERAAAMSGQDFEDNLVMACAELMGLDVIATRNKDDFVDASVEILSPSELLELL